MHTVLSKLLTLDLLKVWEQKSISVKTNLPLSSCLWSGWLLRACRITSLLRNLMWWDDKVLIAVLFASLSLSYTVFACTISSQSKISPLYYEAIATDGEKLANKTLIEGAYNIIWGTLRKLPPFPVYIGLDKLCWHNFENHEYHRSQIFRAKNISCSKNSSYLIFVGGASHEN